MEEVDIVTVSVVRVESFLIVTSVAIEFSHIFALKRRLSALFGDEFLCEKVLDIPRVRETCLYYSI